MKYLLQLNREFSKCPTEWQNFIRETRRNLGLRPGAHAQIGAIDEALSKHNAERTKVSVDSALDVKCYFDSKEDFLIFKLKYDYYVEDDYTK